MRISGCGLFTAFTVCLGIIIIIVACIGLVRYSVSHDES